MYVHCYFNEKLILPQKLEKEYYIIYEILQSNADISLGKGVHKGRIFLPILRGMANVIIQFFTKKCSNRKKTLRKNTLI